MMRDEATRALTVLGAAIRSQLPPAMGGGGFDTEQFIASLDVQALSDADASSLERLTRKIEVGRKLVKSYEAGLSKIRDGSPVRSEFALLLAVLFFQAGMVRRDWKWINTGVKMVEGILLQPSLDIPPGLKDVAAMIVGEGAN